MKNSIDRKTSFKIACIKLPSTQSKETATPLQSIFNSKEEHARMSVNQEQSSKKEQRDEGTQVSNFEKRNSKRETIIEPVITMKGFDPHKEMLSIQPIRGAYYRTTGKLNVNNVVKKSANFS